ncbi:MAG TPA: DMT family transporter [Candidatus Limnocylindrales bacterium]|nr:DMT family transporter [Candidatus Limnocylindrales bacterium]
MEPAVFGLIAIAAVLHVTWNVILKSAGDPLAAATVSMVVGTIVLAPAAVVGWWLVGRPAIPPEAVALGAFSGLFEAAYFGFLSAAYRRGDLSVVYPIARGSATLLAVVFGIVLLGERLGAVGIAGVAALIAGFALLQRPWRAFTQRRSGRNRLDPAVGFALLTGLTIASYSAIDRVGSRTVAPWIYAAMIQVSGAAILVAWSLVRPGRRDPDRPKIHLPRAALGGVLTVAAYMCILFAFSLAPLTAVAPLRESAVVLASGWGALRLGEATGRREAARRIAAAALIVAGAVLLSLEG